MARRVHPVEDVDWTVFEAVTGAVTDVEIDRNVRSVDAESLWLVDRTPDVVSLVRVDDLASLVEVRIDTQTRGSAPPGGKPSLRSSYSNAAMPVRS